MHRQSSRHVVMKGWIPFAWTITLLCGLLYLCIYQVMRVEADQAQIELAQDIATSLYKNETPKATISGTVDIEKSVAPFIVLYNSNGSPVDGTGKLDDHLPSLPEDIFKKTQTHTERRFTWEPRGNTRVATVVRYYQNEKHAGFVLAGKNLRETEHAAGSLLVLIGSAWAFALLSTLGLIALMQSPRHFIEAIRRLLKRLQHKII